jgi:hypothetical protein
MISAITAENSEGTAGFSLFFCSPNRQKPRISAEDEISMADNSRQKQQKQREGRPSPASLRSAPSPAVQERGYKRAVLSSSPAVWPQPLWQ